MKDIGIVTSASGIVCVEVTDPAIEGGSACVPLMTELPRKRFKPLMAAFRDVATDREQVLEDFFREYLGDYVDEVKQEDWLRLVKAWNEASEEHAGATLGE